ncbi:hypothetical protein ACFWW0_29050, partial [Streptomyces violascens]
AAMQAEAGLQPEQEPVMVPAGPGRERRLGVPGPRAAGPQPVPEAEESSLEDAEFAQVAYGVFRQYAHQHNDYPSVEVLEIHLSDGHGVTHPRSTALLRGLIPGFKQRYDAELAEDHIA